MVVSVNDEIQEIEQDCTLNQLLELIGRTDTRGIAVAKNNEVVPRDFWTHTYMNEDDKIMIIQATQGG